MFMHNKRLQYTVRVSEPNPVLGSFMLERGWKGDAPLQERYGESGPSGKGGKVKSRKQAIAIGLSKARNKGQKVPKKKSS
ncbi:hypothetical protein GGQ85_001090 [Nitrobacter vulgaris]|jgi:hypothetical protein|nr:hypothetical protein [Nitrobacter vulgaris]